MSHAKHGILFMNINWPTTVLDRTQKNDGLSMIIGFGRLKSFKGMEASRISRKKPFPSRARKRPGLGWRRFLIKSEGLKWNGHGNYARFLRPNIVGWFEDFLHVQCPVLCKKSSQSTWKVSGSRLPRKKKSQHIHVMFGTCCKRLVRLALEPASPFASLPANSALFTHRCNEMHWICLNLVMYIT